MNLCFTFLLVQQPVLEIINNCATKHVFAFKIFVTNKNDILWPPCLLLLFQNAICVRCVEEKRTFGIQFNDRNHELFEKISKVLQKGWYCSNQSTTMANTTTKAYNGETLTATCNNQNLGALFQWRNTVRTGELEIGFRREWNNLWANWEMESHEQH